MTPTARTARSPHKASPDEEPSGGAPAIIVPSITTSASRVLAREEVSCCFVMPFSWQRASCPCCYHAPAPRSRPRPRRPRPLLENPDDEASGRTRRAAGRQRRRAVAGAELRGVYSRHRAAGSSRAFPAPRARSACSRSPPGSLLTNEGGDGHAEQVFLRGFDAREGQDMEFLRRRRPHQRERQPPRQRLRRHPLHHPGAGRDAAGARGPLRPAAGQLRRRRQRRLPARPRPARADGQVHLRLVQRAPHAPPLGPAGREQPHLRRRRALQDGRLRRRTGTASAPARDGPVRGQAGDDRLLPAHRDRVRRQLPLGRRRPPGRLPGGPHRLLRHLRPNQGGDGSRYSLSADVESRSGDTTFKQQLFVIYRGMRLRENFTGFVNDVQTPLQSPHAQRGDLIDLDQAAETVGARGSARLRGEALGQRQELELGYFRPRRSRERDADADRRRHRAPVPRGHRSRVEARRRGPLRRREPAPALVAHDPRRDSARICWPSTCGTTARCRASPTPPRATRPATRAA